MKLLELYSNLIEKASPGNLSVLLSKDAPRDKLSSFPWKDISKNKKVASMLGNKDGVYMEKLIDGFFCGAIALRSDVHSFVSRRGVGNKESWIVDIEIYTKNETGQNDFIYHTEKRASSKEEALSLLKQMMNFVDSKSLYELIEIPRSGKLSMSKY